MPTPTPAQLSDLLAGCRALDRASQRALYQQYYGFGFAICQRYLTDRDAALEAVNDGFLKIFQELPRFDATRYADLAGSLRGWMHRIMVRTAIDHFRAEHRHSLHAGLDEVGEAHAEASAATPLDALSFDELLRLVGQLSPACRAVFNLYAIDGYTHEEIAEQLSISVGTSKSNLFKARASLKQFLKLEKHHAYAHYVR
ncbi:sigma-70 family RNA polymerase sigma factor [Hymenobacter ginsengisoli]|uniref:Sigma-70 family RNA polymerase sigma factor n=1 Tax=Hymenobacter ginsengisoli TaxID=1051626 RepID=A0ABP8Q0A6_9BACT|nr:MULTISPECIES: sigma-70 family RNA polymerase sigma factor [unclassified Hymenobacter]MBO2032627.1 sigma-70 family RNA polymerase sigma factor [Hymenobacter sp. BT559]